MRRAILQKFILVLFGALILNGLIFYLVGSRVILNSSTRDMLYMLEVLDGSLDYESDLEKTMKKLDSVMDGNNSRLTVIDLDGTVVADTQAQMDEMDNHLDREEIQDALEKGSGYARRRSDTLDEGMLYVAYRSRNADVILRAAVPYSGFQQYLPLFFPASVLSLLIAVVGSFIVTTRLVSSITKPLQDIAKEMLKVKGDYTELNFEHCQYPEINVIADTTMKMSKNVKDYLNQIEKERMIRQEFFSNASHELKTPITSIQGYAELLESGMIQDEATKADFASRIKKEAVRMTGLINDILMISRLEAKEAEVTFSDVRVSVLLEEIIDSLKPQAAEAQVFVHVDCQPLMIHANLQQMRELLTNLISNAIKYNRPGGQVWINIRETDGQMVIRVKDNGVGIPSDSLDRIFERFYRVDKGRSRKQGGTGLGLSIVKHIVNFYHGTIHVSSEPDMGSEFTVFLPMFPEKG
ncbi:MAG TPA: GHKL domain-containing protein [Candidatus Enterocloster excrementigallinarum]|uniref:histidine kinase n=1 Tax=Candidatus Enterocloster excrementigallinarum TaxID=2838558 RepID=A0A9D2PVN9_9FIRM|nr:GHKL domain-containing protein [Candidatus Enterocloster excrementigallinarum]